MVLSTFFLEHIFHSNLKVTLFSLFLATKVTLSYDYQQSFRSHDLRFFKASFELLLHHTDLNNRSSPTTASPWLHSPLCVANLCGLGILWCLLIKTYFWVCILYSIIPNWSLTQKKEFLSLRILIFLSKNQKRKRLLYQARLQNFQVNDVNCFKKKKR